MNKKKIVALIAATTTMAAMGTMTVSAAPVTGPSTTTTVTSDATVNDYDKSPKFLFTLPTSNSLGFTVDPHGLISIGTGSSVDDLQSNGAIVSATNAAALIQNESSVPLKVTAKLHVADTSTSNAVSLKNSHAATATGTGANMLLAAIPSSAKTASVASYAASTTVVPILGTSTGNATTMDFKLQKAEYEVVNTGSGFVLQKKAGTDNLDATAFKVGGEVNPDADWTKYTGSSSEKITLTAVFSVTDASTVMDAVNPNAYGLITTGSALLNDYSSPSGGSTAYGYYDEGNRNTFVALTPFGPDGEAPTPGFAGVQANQITNFKLNGTTCSFTIAAGYIQITPAQSSAAGATAGTWTFTFDYAGNSYTAVLAE